MDFEPQQLVGISQNLESEPYRSAFQQSVGDILLARMALLPKLEVVEVRDIPYEDAYGEILTYYQIHKEAYPSDVADNLGIDYDLVWKVTEELKSQGRLEDL